MKRPFAAHAKINMKTLITLIALIFPSFLFANETDIHSPRSSFKLRSNPDGCGGVVFLDGKTIGLFNSPESGPSIMIPNNFPYTVSFNTEREADIDGLLVIMHPFSRKSQTYIIEAVEILRGEGIRFAPEKRFQNLIQQERKMRDGLKQIENELFHLPDDTTEEQKTPK